MITPFDLAEKVALPDRPGPYTARCASDREHSSPFWFVAGGDGVNCIEFPCSVAKFVTKASAEFLAELWNARPDHWRETTMEVLRLRGIAS